MVSPISQRKISILKVKAKFIKYKDPRRSLGLNILSKRDFKSYEEFVDWLYNYLIPHYYNMPNGPKLWKKMREITELEKSYVPNDFLDYFKKELEKEIKIEGRPPLIHWIYFLNKKWYDL